MLILGFGHKAQNGKDTAAEAIKQYYEQEYYPGFGAPQPKVGIFKFATALYQETNEWIESARNGSGLTDVADLLKLGVREIRGGDLVVTPIPSWVTAGDPTPAPMAPYGKHSKLLQWWGTEFRRAQDPDYWVNKCFATIPANLDIALISDVRFVNEVKGLKQRGGYTIDVQRLREDGTQYYSSDRPADHPSETELDNYNFDYYIKVKTGDVALVQELAITYAVYLRGLQK